MFRRARLQLTLAYSGALAVILLAAGSATYLLLRQSLDRDITSAIEGAAEELRTLDPAQLAELATPAAATSTPEGDNDDGRERDEDDDEGDDDRSGRRGGDEPDDDDPAPPPIAALPTDVFYVMATASGTILANPRAVNLAGIDLAPLASEAADGEHQDEIGTGGARFRIATFATTASADGEPVFLFVGHSLAARDRDLETLLRTLLIAGAAGVAFSVAGGYWLSGRALDPIRKAVESQRRFVSDASHELRTPLAVLRANNELLLRHPGEPIAANIEHVEAIALEAEHMSALVDDLLTLARADEGRLLGTLGVVDLGEAVEGVVRDVQPLAAARGITLTATARPALTEGDPQRLRQLVMILVDNAVKYTPAGGHVAVGCQRAGRNVVLTVSDTGPGVPEAERARIFERFARLEASRGRTESGGTGLGLAIAKEIALAHHGQIGVDTAPGGGAVFTVRLRAAA